MSRRFAASLPPMPTRCSARILHALTIIAGDIRDAATVDASLRGVDTVFHTAAIAGVWGPWRRYRQHNVVGTQNVIAACRRHEVRRLIYTSSPSVVFTTTDQSGVNESIPYTTRWLCNYPRSKALAEQAVLGTNGRDGLLTCALRPHLLWGPGDRQLLPRLLTRARAGQIRRVGDGKNLIDIVYVENAAAAHIQAADALSDGSPVCGRPYFISQDEPVNLLEMGRRFTFAVRPAAGSTIDLLFHRLA